MSSASTTLYVAADLGDYADEAASEAHSFQSRQGMWVRVSWASAVSLTQKGFQFSRIGL